MKKLIFATLAALSMAAFGLTPKEVIDSKDWTTINAYCVSNNVNVTYFIKENCADFAQYKGIYEIANCVATFELRCSGEEKFGEDNLKTLTYDANACVRKSPQNIISKIERPVKMNWKTTAYEKSGYCRMHYDTFKIIARTCTNNWDVAYLAAKEVDRMFGNNEEKELLYTRCTDAQTKLDIAIALNDVDKIIDQLLVVDDVTAVQAEGIIKPINAVASDYRKADILKALNNINSRCTIKLYDDQKTWEPILAKIRAMISVRQ